jgi:5-methylcytosine-specific restriction endonuclease McrA
MSNKNQVSKKTRFEVFKRDDFTCQYCGKTPPEVILEVDHINPKSKGGTGDINNLITACFDCNRGKGKILLEKVPNTIKDNYEILKEKELQLIEYNKLLKKIKQRQNKELQSINEIYTKYFLERLKSGGYLK